MKKKLCVMICFIFALCGAVLMTVPAQAKVKKNSEDVKNIYKLIKNIEDDEIWNLDSSCYTWNKKTGRLTEIDFSEHSVKGKLSFNNFSQLESISIEKNKITNVNFSNLNKLKYLDCDNNKIVSMDLSNLRKL